MQLSTEVPPCGLSRKTVSGQPDFFFPKSKPPKRTRQKVHDLLWTVIGSHGASLCHTLGQIRAYLGSGRENMEHASQRAELRDFADKIHTDTQGSAWY